MTPEQREELKQAALAASPGPWKGDRYDGTVKYQLLDANDNPVILGDNGNSGGGPYGISNYEDEVYLKAANPSDILSLIAQVEALTVPADYFAPVVLNPTCACAKCNPNAAGRMMILCATCGNKRCPRATDHRLACTDSNEPGQVGSSYGPTIPAIPGTKEGA